MMPSTAKTVLVTGAAGYVGSGAVLCLKEAGFSPVVVDSLERGSRDTIDALGVPFYRGDVGDGDLIAKVCAEHRPAGALHFAAYAYVGESVEDPERYYRNNVASSIAFFSALRKNGVMSVVFSSTCATYGISDAPLQETAPTAPINPYGRSKLMVEQVLRDFGSAYGMRSIIFRYFNVAGTHPSLSVGERHQPETHLIPRAIFAAMGGAPLQVFGTDYPTPDGTCIRDYVHVVDIASAHVLGLRRLFAGGESATLNIGTGQGYSVKEVIAAAEKSLGCKVPWDAHPRRAGDPPRLVAAPGKLREALGWSARSSSLETIVQSAVDWYRRHPALVS